MTTVRLFLARAAAVMLGLATVALGHLPRPAAPAPLRHRRVFIVGCPRSGTTWVQRSIQRHPDVIGTEESYAVSRITNAARRRPSVIGWARLYYGLAKGRITGHRVGLHRYVDLMTLVRLSVRALRDRGGDDEVADRLIRSVFDTYFVEHGGDETKVFAEKTPWNLRVAPRLLDTYPEAVVIEVLRDGRDVCVSMQELATKETWLKTARAEQISEWVDFVRRGQRLRADPRYADRVLLVRYEDLKADFKAELCRVFAFVGLAATAELMAEIAEATDFAQNKDTGAGSHTRKGIVGDWVNHFDEDDIRLFEALAGRTAREVGYA